MGEMREWWQNAYPSETYGFGGRYPTPERCASWATPRAFARIHVRLKPEGAPKRYASDGERAAWERDPDNARALAKQGIKFEAEPRERVVPSWLYA